jgi:hypothetical protein
LPMLEEILMGGPSSEAIDCISSILTLILLLS